MDVTEFRKGKDEFFRSDPHSPLTSEQRMEFKGLRYFDENPVLRFELMVKPFEVQKTIEMQTSTGDVQTYTRYGIIEFEVEGVAVSLTVYQSRHGYFIPFVDALVGQETYGAGRYLDPDVLPGGRLAIDFNLAYNPYCAYNDLYSCPIPPAENRLSVPIRAGEKLFK